MQRVYDCLLRILAFLLMNEGYDKIVTAWTFDPAKCIVGSIELNMEVIRISFGKLYGPSTVRTAGLAVNGIVTHLIALLSQNEESRSLLCLIVPETSNSSA
jgi:hypothetical protein